jgi:hypothetical protein
MMILRRLRLGDGGRLRGAETIDAEIRHWSHHDALKYASAVGASQRGLSIGDAIERVEARGKRSDN